MPIALMSATMSATVRKNADEPISSIIASSWSRRSRTSCVGFTSRSSIPRRHRSASTDEALRPAGTGKSGKCMRFNPRSNVHVSAIRSVASQRSGRSLNNARICREGLRYPSAFARVTWFCAIGTIFRMHSSASARNASSGTR